MSNRERTNAIQLFTRPSFVPFFHWMMHHCPASVPLLLRLGMYYDPSLEESKNLSFPTFFFAHSIFSRCQLMPYMSCNHVVNEIERDMNSMLGPSDTFSFLCGSFLDPRYPADCRGWTFPETKKEISDTATGPLVPELWSLIPVVTVLFATIFVWLTKSSGMQGKIYRDELAYVMQLRKS